VVGDWWSVARGLLLVVGPRCSTLVPSSRLFHPIEFITTQRHHEKQHNLKPTSIRLYPPNGFASHPPKAILATSRGIPHLAKRGSLPSIPRNGRSDGGRSHSPYALENKLYPFQAHLRPNGIEAFLAAHGIVFVVIPTSTSSCGLRQLTLGNAMNRG
jgi:hypothetical protein